MRPEMSCQEARPELSAWIDGEVDEVTARTVGAHLESCPDCSRQESRLRTIRRTLRLQSAEPVPDLTAAILARLHREAAAQTRRREWVTFFRVAAVAALVAALITAELSPPWSIHPLQSAKAAQIVKEVRSAAQEVRGYRASYRIVEHGWSSRVPRRRFSARVWFSAPERFRLQIRDLTAYPSSSYWPRNDLDVVTNASRSWQQGPYVCPNRLVTCATSQQQRSVVHRQPFDGSSSLPTDIVVPLETLAQPGGVAVLGSTTIAGRRAYQVELPVSQAAPLIASIEAGGSWRPFYPTDHVYLWIDAATWFPLHLTVKADSSVARAAWAAREQLAQDRAGATLLDVTATSFSTAARIQSSRFAAPARGVVNDEGFRGLPWRATSRWGRPRHVAGLHPYRAGKTDDNRRLLSYSNGLTWLKVLWDPAPEDRRTDLLSAEQVELAGDKGFAYYRPAVYGLSTGPPVRRVDLYTRGAGVLLESNLPRGELLRVASSLPVAGRKLPARPPGSAGDSTRRLADGRELRALAWARHPIYLPEGYRATSGLLSRSHGQRTLTVYYLRSQANYESTGITLVQSRPAPRLPPTSENAQAARVDTVIARWSPESGQLEWMRGSTYTSVTVPDFDRASALRIARSMR